MSRRAEVFAVAAAMILLFVVEVLISGGSILFSRPLWLDEVHSVLAASHASPIAVVHDVARGPDHAPPLLHLVEWLMYVALGALTPVALRVMSLLAVCAALALTFATLRRRHDLVPSVAGALAVASHALVVSHAFEARFYALWLLFAAGFAWALGIDADSERSRRRDVAVAVFAVLVCTVHWFGVLTLGLMCAGAFYAMRADARQAMRRLAPAVAGLVALALCAPILLMQRSALTTATWVPGPNGQQVWDMASAFFLTMVPVAAVLILLSRRLAERPITLSLRAADTNALLALGLMPLVIAILSWVVQPTMLTRYAIVATLWWAPLVAAVLDGLRPLPRFVLCGVLVVIGYRNVVAEASQKAQFAAQVAADVQSFDAAREMDAPIVFQARHVLYPVAGIEPQARPRMGFVAIPDTTIDAMFPSEGPNAWLRRFFKFERDVAAIHERLYGFPVTFTVGQLDTLPQFLLLATDMSLPRGYKDVLEFGQVIAPNHTPTRLRENLTLFRRASR